MKYPISPHLVALALTAATVVPFVASPAQAHHSFGFYDMRKTAQIHGVVAKYEWSNPHSWLFVTVDLPAGQTVYGFEMVSVGEMLRRGWARNSVKTGDSITVTFHPMRDGTHNGMLISARDDGGRLIGRPTAQ